MAVAVLSPWPSTPVASAAAVTCLRESISLFANTDPAHLSDATYIRLGSAASALVERDAPLAPQAIKNEAVIRAAGFLAQSSPAHAMVGEESGNWKYDATRAGIGALRHSGAMALLSPWKIRRAGRISEAD